jgi:hypothetical protein
MTFVVCHVLHEFQIPGLEGILVDLNKHCAIERYNMLDGSSTESFEAWFGDMSRCTIYNIHHLDTSLLELPYLLSFTSEYCQNLKKNCFQMSQWLFNEIFVMHCYRLLFSDSLYSDERIKMVSSIEGIFWHLHANLLPFK